MVLKDLDAAVNTAAADFHATGAAPGSQAASQSRMRAAAESLQSHEDRVVPVTGKRAVIARRLSESAFTAPHYFLRAAVKMDTVLEMRKALNDERTRSGLSKVSLNAFFVKMAAEALKRYPEVNASFRGDTITSLDLRT